MDNWRITEELDKLREWDADAVCDALNIQGYELVDAFINRAIDYVQENNE